MDNKEKKEKIIALGKLLVKLNKHVNYKFFNKEEIILLYDGVIGSIASIILDGQEDGI